VLAAAVGRRVEAGAQPLHGAAQRVAPAFLQRLVDGHGGQVDGVVGGRQQEHAGLRPPIEVFGQQHAQRGGLAGAGRAPQEGAAVLHQRERRALRWAQPAKGLTVECRAIAQRLRVGQVGQAGQGALGPGGVPPRIGQGVEKTGGVEADQEVGPGRRDTGVLQHQLVVFRHHGEHAGATFRGRAPPDRGAVEAVVEQRPGRGLAGPLALGIHIAGLERHAPQRAFAFAAQHLEVVVLGCGAELGIQRGAQVGEAHRSGVGQCAGRAKGATVVAAR